jgi:hypothetical protein
VRAVSTSKLCFCLASRALSSSGLDFFTVTSFLSSEVDSLFLLLGLLQASLLLLEHFFQEHKGCSDFEEIIVILYQTLKHLLHRTDVLEIHRNE